MAAEETKRFSLQVSDKDIPVVDEWEETPTFYADGMQGMLNVVGTSRIGLFQFTQDISSPEFAIKKLVVARLVVPTAALRPMANWLAEQAAALEADEKSQKKPE